MGAGGPGMGMGMGGMGGMPGMGVGGGMGMNPYAMGQGQGPFGPAQSPGSTPTDAAGNELKPFDSSQMKRGRMGHYGYLDGRGEFTGTDAKWQMLMPCRARWSSCWLHARRRPESASGAQSGP